MNVFDIEITFNLRFHFENVLQLPLLLEWQNNNNKKNHSNKEKIIKQETPKKKVCFFVVFCFFGPEDEGEEGNNFTNLFFWFCCGLCVLYLDDGYFREDHSGVWRDNRKEFSSWKRKFLPLDCSSYSNRLDSQQTPPSFLSFAKKYSCSFLGKLNESVFFTEGCSRDGPTLSVSVVTDRQRDTWPSWGAEREGWALAFWQRWKKSVFSHDFKSVKDLDLVHLVQSGDAIEVYLSEEGELSFTLNGNEVGKFPSLLPWKETLYPAVFSYTNGGKVTVKIEVGSGIGIKPAKRT